MKLLRSEAEFFAWMRTQWDEPDDETGMRAIFGVPNQYPCYVFWRAFPEDDPELGVLYEADVSDMLTVLHRAKNSTQEGDAQADRKPAEWEYATGDTAAPWEHDVDAFNREQRAAREAYALGLVDGDIASRSGDVPNESCRADAAKRYPLKKREPRIIPDPHGAGEWRVHADGNGFAFRGDSKGVSWSAPEYEENVLLWTPDRVRALAELLNSPWAWVDDTTPEQEST